MAVRVVQPESRGETTALCSAGFRTCCIADFPVGRASAIRGGWNSSSARGLGNPRYSRLGSLRYLCPTYRSHSSFGDRVQSGEHSPNENSRFELKAARPERASVIRSGLEISEALRVTDPRSAEERSVVKLWVERRACNRPMAAQQFHTVIKPCRIAYRASAATLLMPSLAIICWRWVSTVLGLISRSEAMFFVFSPCAR